MSAVMTLIHRSSDELDSPPESLCFKTLRSEDCFFRPAFKVRTATEAITVEFPSSPINPGAVSTQRLIPPLHSEVRYGHSEG